MVMPDSLQIYAAQDALTEPGDLVHLYDGLPADPSSLRDIVSGLIVHVSWAAKYGIPADTPLSRETLPVARRLRLIQSACGGPLQSLRPPERRTFGTCRDFALLLCSLLRHHAVPARVRCGFATYFATRRFADHWVCEYWLPAERRWALADAQLDAMQCAELGIAFDCADLPKGSFLAASEAWVSARSGDAAADEFGHGEAGGLWFLQVNLHRDLLALANRHTSAWDTWRAADEPARQLSGAALAVNDRLAEDTMAYATAGSMAALCALTATRQTPPWMQ